jgi:hypothetical protein
METITRFEDLTIQEKVAVIIRATAQQFYSDRELQKYNGMEGWWITLRGGRRVFVEARYVVRGDVDQQFAEEVVDTFRTFKPQFLSRTTYVSLHPAETTGWWKWKEDAGLMGTYQFDTKHVTVYDDDIFRTNGDTYTIGGTVAHELAHSHFSRVGLDTFSEKREAREGKMVRNFVDAVYAEDAAASPYALWNYYIDVDLGHAENFAEWGRVRYEATAYGGEYKEKWNDLVAENPQTAKAFMPLWKSYGGA